VDAPDIWDDHCPHIRHLKGFDQGSKAQPGHFAKVAMASQPASINMFAKIPADELDPDDVLTHE